MDINTPFGCTFPILILIHERSCFATQQDWTTSILSFLPLLDEYPCFLLQIRNKTPLAKEEATHLLSLLPFHSRIIINIPSIEICSFARHRTEKELGLLGISASIHSIEKAQQYQTQYQFMHFGPVFEPISKVSEARGLDALSKLSKEVQIPIIAVGGITEQNIRQILDLSVAGVGIIGSILQSKEPLITTKKFLNMIQDYIEIKKTIRKSPK